MLPSYSTGQRSSRLSSPMRTSTALSWVGTFIGSQRGQLTITEQQAYARTRIEQLEEIAAAVEDSEIAAS